MLDIRTGDVLSVKKPHPCGCDRFRVLRTGADVRLRCEQCGREVMLPRSKAEKMTRSIIREETD